MLHAILTILKILLWIILAILGLALFIVLLVLFAPIKYKVDAKYHGTALINAKVSFLIASVRLMFDQENKKLDYCIRLAGIKLRLGKGNKAKESPCTEDLEDLDQKLVEETSSIDKIDKIEELPLDSERKDTTTDESVGESSYDEDDEIQEFDLYDENIDRDVPKEEQKAAGRIKAFFVALRGKFKAIRQKAEEVTPEKIEEKIELKLDKIRKYINKLKRFWDLKCTVKTRKYLKKYLLGLAKHIGPRKIKGYVRYGFGDPCKTGQVTGYLSLLPFVYGKHFSLYPDFYDKIIDTELLVKGRIRIGYIIRIVLNINIWRTISVARKIFKGKKREV